MPIQPGDPFKQTHGVNATERVTFMLTTEQMQWLKDQVVAQNKSMSQIIREAITNQQEAQ